MEESSLVRVRKVLQVDSKITQIVKTINDSNVKITVPDSSDSWNRKVGDDIVIMTLGDEDLFALMIGSLPHDIVKDLAGRTVTLTKEDTLFTAQLFLSHTSSYPTAQFSGVRKGEYILKIE